MAVYVKGGEISAIFFTRWKRQIVATSGGNLKFS
jgi:hypothetical protein